MIPSAAQLTGGSDAPELLLVRTGRLQVDGRLIVDRDRCLVLVHEGRSVDLLTTGIHVLDEQTLPLLNGTLGGLPPAGHALPAEGYVVCLSPLQDLPWSTQKPLDFSDPEFDVVRLRARGSYALRLVEPRQFIDHLVGKLGRYTAKDIHGLLEQLLVDRLQRVLAGTELPLRQLERNIAEMEQKVSQLLAPTLSESGLRLQELAIDCLEPPVSVQRSLASRTQPDIPHQPKQVLAVEQTGARPASSGQAPFCAHCGQLISHLCSTCQAPVSPSARFCHQCGEFVAR